MKKLRSIFPLNLRCYKRVFLVKNMGKFEKIHLFSKYFYCYLFIFIVLDHIASRLDPDCNFRRNEKFVRLNYNFLL